MNTNELSKLTPRIIGHIGVDAGIVWIGDPCYILHIDNLSSTVGKDWGEFCALLGNNPTKSFNYEMGHEGLGVCTSTKYGDGVYSVIGFFEEGSNRPSCVMVDFADIFSDEEIEGNEEDITNTWRKARSFRCGI